ncbi:uncharacterized protein LOC123215387 isoform X2 [Mangifera indica]|uniref:uncharacterized protein LOC123215387 isoform X2 n=1 Tax=Mangifera indica TaxID=29780 RepID=UPI001CFB6ABA|nr:uncharacterized protein LOC123215387 isoform X2 [Mangifera indica]
MLTTHTHKHTPFPLVTVMAAELQPPDNPITAAIASTTNATATPASTNTTAILAVQIDPAGPPLAPKRQRRPSVRLGEIGDQPSYDSHVRCNKPFHHSWRLPRDSSSKSIKARSLTNLVNGSDSQDFHENENKNQNGDGINSNNLEFSHRKVKSKRAPTTKRARTNWISRIDQGAEGDSREDGEETFRDFDHNSDSPLKDQSPVHSVDNVAMDFWPGHRRGAPGSAPGRTRVSDSRENERTEYDNYPGMSDGVRSFLIELGLSRYAPVFEIHGVDDEVLPMLTLEDLKDMGINAVGSRRKMYTAIQKRHAMYQSPFTCLVSSCTQRKYKPVL